MQQFENENSEGPYIALRAINVVNEALRGHIDGRADIDVLELLPAYHKKYLVILAKPKSAIFAFPPLKKTLATFKSRWIMFLSAR